MKTIFECESLCVTGFPDEVIFNNATLVRAKVQELAAALQAWLDKEGEGTFLVIAANNKVESQWRTINDAFKSAEKYARERPGNEFMVYKGIVKMKAETKVEVTTTVLK